MRFVFLTLITLAVNLPLLADSEPVLSRYFVKQPSDSAMRKIARQFEVVARRPDGFEIIVPAQQKTELLALAPGAKLLEADISSALRWMDFSGYHTFTTVESHLERIVTEHPQIASLEVYGKSKEGRSLYALKISDNVRFDEEEPELMITSATHGDEIITVEVLMGVVDALVENYDETFRSPRLTNIVNNYELFFIPVVNPDGYVRKSRYANGVDPNRDYPWPGQPTKKSNECIDAIIDFFHKHQIRGSFDIHAMGGMFMYPWAYTAQKVPADDHKVFHEVTRKMAATNGYRYGQIPDLLYTAQGSSADYYYWKGKTIAIATEIADSKAPSPSQIPYYVNKHLESTWLFIESF